MFPTFGIALLLAFAPVSRSVTMRWIAIPAALVLMAVNGNDPSDHGAIDDLDKARKEFQATVRKAQDDYDAVVETAAGKLRVRVEAALDRATKERQLDSVKALSAELDTLAAGALPVFGGRGDVVPGTWRIAYHPNGARRTYVVRASGSVACRELDLSGSIRKENGGLFLDLHDGKLERLTFAGSRLFVEHFDPKEAFPRLSEVGIGESLDAR